MWFIGKQLHYGSVDDTGTVQAISWQQLNSRHCLISSLHSVTEKSKVCVSVSFSFSLSVWLSLADSRVLDGQKRERENGQENQNGRRTVASGEWRVASLGCLDCKRLSLLDWMKWLAKSAGRRREKEREKVKEKKEGNICDRAHNAQVAALRPFYSKRRGRRKKERSKWPSVLEETLSLNKHLSEVTDTMYGKQIWQNE